MKQAIIAAMERSGDPLAPITLQKAYGAVTQAGKLFASMGNQTKAIEMQAKLLHEFPDEMDHIACDPDFLCALCVLLVEGLRSYRQSLEPHSD